MAHLLDLWGRVVAEGTTGLYFMGSCHLGKRMGTRSRYFLIMKRNVLKNPEIRPRSSVSTVKTRQFREIAACSSSKLPSRAELSQAKWCPLSGLPENARGFCP